MERHTRATRAHLAGSATEFAEAAGAVIAGAVTGGAPAAVLAVKLDPDDAAAEAAQSTAVREQVIELIRRNLRGTDVVSHATEEVLVLLPGAAHDQGHLVAGRLCSAIRNHTFAGSSGDRLRRGVTASMGVASAPLHGGEVYGLASAARDALSVVRDAGGDGSAVASDQPGQRPERSLEIGRFIGRADELAAARKWLDEAIGGSPRAIAVIGEAGSGRATLVRQFEPEVRLRGGSLVIARARNTTVRVPYSIWTNTLLALRRLPDAPSRTWRELMHLNASLAGSDGEPAGSKFRLIEEITEYVRMTARTRPLVLVLDEMQWADSASWDVLDYLLTRVERERILVCLTLREDAAQTEIVARRKGLERIDGYHELRLSRLTRDEVKRWLEAAMQRQEIGRELLAYLYRQTEGNPLFITQLARCMVEEGSLRHDGQRWQWSPVSELRLPNGLDAVIARRIGHLAPETQGILQRAAVIGRQFEVDVLLSTGVGSETEVRAAIDQAVSAGILQPNYERGGNGQVFVHTAVADALVASIPPSKLAAAHTSVARALESRPLSEAEAAIHFDLGGDSADAYRWSMEAATHAENVYAYDAAGEFLQMAARNATSPAELAEVRVRMAHLAETMGRYDEVEELCDLAIEWFAGQGDRERALTLRRLRERARKELGQPARVTLDALRELDAEAAAIGSARERVEILTLMSQTFGRLGESKEAERLAAECVEMAEHVGDASLLAGALNRLAITVEHENPARARGYFERALALYQRLGDVRGQARCHNNLGIVAQLEMRPDYGRDSLQMAMTLARGAGIPDLAGTAAMNLGVVNQKLGDYARAKDLFSDALAQFATVKNSELQLFALYNMANLEREGGDWTSGAELYEATSSLAQRIGQSDVEIGAMAGEGLCLLSLGKMDAVDALSEEIELRMTARQGWFQGHEVVDALRVRKAIAENRYPEAMDAFKRARALADESDLYSAAWLTAACADLLLEHYPAEIRDAIRKYAGQVGDLGFEELTRKYKILQDLQTQDSG